LQTYTMIYLINLEFYVKAWWQSDAILLKYPEE
jgi:hypothetical protein